jgi:predicted ABC-class ATPase
MSDPTDDVMRLVEEIKPLLAGKSAFIQGAVLADLLAIFLAGHIVPGDQAATNQLREDILSMHIEQVRELVPVNAELYTADP